MENLKKRNYDWKLQFAHVKLFGWVLLTDKLDLEKMKKTVNKKYRQTEDVFNNSGNTVHFIN